MAGRKRLYVRRLMMMTFLTEKRIEERFCKAVKKAGGLALKFSAQFKAGVPDRIVLMPGGKIYFVELKREKGAVSEIQKYVFEEFAEYGFPVRVISSVEEIKKFIAEVTANEV